MDRGTEAKLASRVVEGLLVLALISGCGGTVSPQIETTVRALDYQTGVHQKIEATVAAVNNNWEKLIEMDFPEKYLNSVADVIFTGPGIDEAGGSGTWVDFEEGKGKYSALVVAKHMVTGIGKDIILMTRGLDENGLTGWKNFKGVCVQAPDTDLAVVVVKRPEVDNKTSLEDQVKTRLRLEDVDSNPKTLSGKIAGLGWPGGHPDGVQPIGGSLLRTSSGNWQMTEDGLAILGGGGDNPSEAVNSGTGLFDLEKQKLAGLLVGKLYFNQKIKEKDPEALKQIYVALVPKNFKAMVEQGARELKSK